MKVAIKRAQNSKKLESSVRSPSVRFGSKFEYENSARLSSRIVNSTRFKFEKKWFGPMSNPNILCKVIFSPFLPRSAQRSGPRPKIYVCGKRTPSTFTTNPPCPKVHPSPSESRSRPATPDLETSVSERENFEQVSQAQQKRG